MGIKINGRKTLAGVVMMVAYLLTCVINGEPADESIVTAILGVIGLGLGHKVVKIERKLTGPGDDAVDSP